MRLPEVVLLVAIWLATVAACAVLVASVLH